MLDTLGIDQPQWAALTSLEERSAFCERVEYPRARAAVVRLSGAAMSVVYGADDLEHYLKQAASVSKEHPVISRCACVRACLIAGRPRAEDGLRAHPPPQYISTKEIDVDAVAKDCRLLMHAISEHIENAGVHSGDATLVQPPQDLAAVTIQKLEAATARSPWRCRSRGP